MSTVEERRRTRLFVVLLLLLSVSLAFFLLSTVPSGADSGQSSRISSSQNGSIVLDLSPGEDTLYQNESRHFRLAVVNPPANDETISGFLYAGYEERERPPNVTVAGQAPNVRYRDIMGRYLEFELAPGGERVFPVVVHRHSGPGDHELNATAVYFEDWNVTRESATAAVDVQATECKIPCQILRTVRGVVSWVENNWEWIVSLLSVSVAIASLVAPNRVRRFVGLSEIPTDKDPKE